MEGYSVKQQVYHVYGGYLPNAAMDDVRWHTIVTGTRPGNDWQVWKGNIGDKFVVFPLLSVFTEMPTDEQRKDLAPPVPEIDFSEPELPEGLGE